MAAIEFEQQGGMSLIQQVMRTPQAAVGEKIMNVCFIPLCHLNQMYMYTFVQ